MKKRNPFLTITCFLLLLINLSILTKYILFKHPAASFAQLNRIRSGHNRPVQSGQKNLRLFASIRNIQNSRMSDSYKLQNLGGNILGFMPLGLLLPLLFFRHYSFIKTVLSVFLISLAFESIQLYAHLGVFDVDDLLLNTLGGLAGYLFYGLSTLLKPSRPPVHVNQPASYPGLFPPHPLN